jgi:hypothetical protein
MAPLLALSGCILSDPPTILPRDLVTDVEYPGWYLNLWAREALTIESDSDGQYRIVGKDWTSRAAVIDIPHGGVAFLCGNAPNGATYLALAKSDEGLAARPLDLNLESGEAEQAFPDHGMQARKEGHRVHLVSR